MDETLIKKLTAIVESQKQLEDDLSKVDISSDPNKYAEMAKKHSDMSSIVELFRQWETLTSDISDAEELLNEETDEEMKSEYEDIIKNSTAEIENIVTKIKVGLLPKDPSDEKDVLVEIRPGAGGEEASIWVGDLFKMYSRFAERNSWNVEKIEMTDSDMGGYSKVIFAIKSKGVYSKLKFEAGAHRVQRIPKTESQGRVHTSIATVAVLPEAEEVDIDIDQNDLKVDVYRSSGPGGQSVNTTDSAVRITHLPTGIVVTSSEKSQHRNREIALQVLKTRLFDLERQRVDSERSENRKIQVGSGDRSERIRTYNFPQGRITDHRINLTLHKLEEFMEGEIFDEMIENLVIQAQENELSII